MILKYLRNFCGFPSLIQVNSRYQNFSMPILVFTIIQCHIDGDLKSKVKEIIILSILCQQIQSFMNDWFFKEMYVFFAKTKQHHEIRKQWECKIWSNEKGLYINLFRMLREWGKSIQPFLPHYETRCVIQNHNMYTCNVWNMQQVIYFVLEKLFF